MAVKNNIGGLVHETKSALNGIRYQILDYLSLTIVHNLCVSKNIKFSDIRCVVSHPQALLQCSNFLQAKLPNRCLVEYGDTALAARDLSAGRLDSSSGIICSERAVRKYNLRVLEQNIANNANSITDFVLVKLA